MSLSANQFSEVCHRALTTLVVYQYDAKPVSIFFTNCYMLI